MHPLFLLAILTFIVAIGYLVWNKISVERHKAPGKPSGIGGESDPLSGDTPGIRDADELRASLDEADGSLARQRYAEKAAEGRTVIGSR